MTRLFSRCAAAIAFVISFGVASSALAADEATGWSGEVSFSASAQTGTTRTLSGTVDAKTTRTWEEDEAAVRLTATYGASDKDDSVRETTKDSQALFADWMHTLHERFFVGTQAELSRDSTQDRRLRFRVDSGPGYRVWEDLNGAKNHFDVSSGLGYRYEVYDGNTGTSFEDTDVDHFIDAVAGFEYKHLLFDEKIEYTHTGNVALPANSPSAFIVRSEIIVGVPLTEAWSFRTSFLVEYTNEVPDEVKETTTNATVGLGYKF